ncbi:MAG: ATP-binding protein [Acidobacteriota bacterium]|jgi:Mg-chelatase subunit ChlI|nr:ATP-binding protein [Acidobacteriota bacterium]
MSERKRTYSFTAIVGQDDMKLALVLNAVNPALGGVLIRGEKGTAKSTAVRALAELLPEREEVTRCRFGCDPQDAAWMCDECRERLEKGETLLPHETRRMKVVDLPVAATEDRVVGTLDMEHAIKTGEKRFETGLLARANRNILYVDEVNLLDDHLVDLILDAAAMGVNTVEREGVSYSHPARFILVGTMNPEEGDLRPQLLDRFGLSVNVLGEREAAARAEVIENRMLYETAPDAFFAKYEDSQRRLSRQIVAARELLAKVRYSRAIVELVARSCIKLEVDGHRADIATLKTAVTIAALRGASEETGNGTLGNGAGEVEVCEADIYRAARLALPHRLRRRPFEDVGADMDVLMKSLLSS